ncbi:hypothetical protein FOPE_05043 [Fonsecaea pedrosoi]|nr:hypothetical protein FOPE_05043 [Fonsecaea pedrosoi]
MQKEKGQGYDRYPVFIIRDQTGLQRRRPLEEARPTTTTTTTPQPTVQNPNTILLSRPSSIQLNDAQLVSSFWDRYSADPARSSRVREPAWLYHSLCITTPTTTLRLALLSLAYTRTGRLQNNQVLLTKGQELYCQALRSMQTALYDPQLMRSDDTLAAARCMVLYESFESTSGDMGAWQNHIKGIARIIQLRGPKCHCDPLPKSILESMRYNAMVVCLTTKESSFLGGSDWPMQPWTETPKDFEQQLYDYGFTLANLFRRGEEACRCFDRGVILQIFEEIRDCYSGMGTLREELMAFHGEHDHSNRRGLRDPSSSKPIETGSAFDLALLLALELSFSIFAVALIDQCPTDIFDRRPDLRAEISAHTDTSRRRDVSKLVIRLVHRCLGAGFEHARQRLIFPLNVVRWEVRKTPEDSARVKALFETIASGNQFRIARSVHDAGCSTLPSVVTRAERDEVAGWTMEHHGPMSSSPLCQGG